ncbi:hypothetical protein BJ878DRAFT_521225 [Calycina marina]|uniref:Uncharacterized protein n=1 Tax=Calycina marina TaxID=1763456 RepID=A0A9P8CC65_9HELO|nr:hypothetical protein BJ878DRAFT_521225 [Calycina marina]
MPSSFSYSHYRSYTSGLPWRNVYLALFLFFLSWTSGYGNREENLSSRETHGQETKSPASLPWTAPASHVLVSTAVS